MLKVIKRLLDGGVSTHLLVYAPKFQYNEIGKRNILTTAKYLGVEKNVNVFLENLEEDEKLAAYNLADLVVFPALQPTAVDPPITVLEAMSCGKSVLTSRVQSLPYFVEHGRNVFCQFQLGRGCL
jgi:glycosyltransferase involved in cell wall biosynthesis